MSQLPFENIQREVLIRKESITDPNYGSSPELRKTDDIISYGIINLDKPKGPTSHQSADYVKKILNIDKAGHCGTLDPAVTGVLPVALGRGTKVLQALITAGKEYVALMHIHREVDENIIKRTLEKFQGKIKQMPPLKSAVRRIERERYVYYLDILEIDGQDVLFKVGCQAGTYIRKLIHDIGRELKTGANMQELRRTKAGPFDETTLFTLQDLADAYHFYKKDNNDKFIRKIIQPIECAVSHLPKIWISDYSVESLAHGMNLNIPGIAKLHADIKKDDLVAIMTLKDELVALGIANLDSKNILESQKGLAVNIHKVFMPPGVYPKRK